MRSLRAGLLRHRLAIQTATESRDGIGGTTRTWATAATRWGSIEPASMREAVQASQVDANLVHKITMRYYAGLSASMRFLHESRAFNIISILNTDSIDKKMEVLAVEDV